MIKFVKQHFGNKLIVGAEIGVFKGKHAREILMALPNLVKLYLVDPYEEYVGYSPRKIKEIVEGPGSAQKHLDKASIDSSRYKWIIDHFSADIIPEGLDFIYIDGNHSYKAVKFDILEARKIVRRGGVLGGHDYRPKNGVFKAVVEAYGESHQVERMDWWVIHQPV
jgi:hypothetical protein